MKNQPQDVLKCSLIFLNSVLYSIKNVARNFNHVFGQLYKLMEQ